MGGALDAVRTERRALVAELRGLAAGAAAVGTGVYGSGSGDRGVDAVAFFAALRDNMEAEGKLTTEFQLWFSCELLAPLQHVRCDATAFPLPPDSLLVGDMVVAEAER